MRRFLSSRVKLLSVALAGIVLVPAYVWSEEEAAAPAVAVTYEGDAGVKNLLPNLENGKTIFAEGKGEVPACVSCHGEEGLGDDNLGTPRTAGLGFVYLRKQLYDFANDKRIDNTMNAMNDIAKALTEQDRIDIAAHEFSIKLPAQASASNMQEIKDGGAVPVGVRHMGKGIVFSGIPKQGVPACSSCHQYNGRGTAPLYPAIGGQRYVYLVTQLKAWRDGSVELGRANDILGQMRAVAVNLTDDDIYNVATYLTSAPDRPAGDPARPPEAVPRMTEEILHEAAHAPAAPVAAAEPVAAEPAAATEPAPAAEPAPATE